MLSSRYLPHSAPINKFSTMSYFLFAIILVITLVQFRIQNGRSETMKKLIGKIKKSKGEKKVETV